MRELNTILQSYKLCNKKVVLSCDNPFFIHGQRFEYIKKYIYLLCTIILIKQNKPYTINHKR